MSTIKVSIIIPIYNTQQYLRECLDSARNQTLRDIEIICIDDGSTDSSGAICDEYAAKDNRFIVIHQEHTGLASRTRNHGLDIARGEYIALLDSDDWYYPEYCQLMYSKAIEEQADLVSCFSSLKSGLKIFWRSLFYSSKQINPSLTEKVKRAFCTGTGIWRLWKTSIIQENNLRFHNELLFEDTAFIIEFLVYAKRVATVFKPIYYYRQREGSSMHTSKNAIRGIKMFDALYHFLFNKPCFEDFKPYYYKMKWNSLASVYRRIKNQPQEWRDEFLNDIRSLATEDEKSGNMAIKYSFKGRVYRLYNNIFPLQK